MLALVFAYVVGVLLVQCFPRLPSIPWLLGCVAGAAVLAALRRPVSACLAALLLGLAWSAFSAQHLLGLRLPPHHGRPLNCSVTGRVVSLPQRRGGRSRFLLRVVRPGKSCSSGAPPGVRLRLSWYGARPGPRAGELWRLPVRAWSPHGFSNPGGMDYERWLFRHGIHGTGYVTSAGRPRRLEDSGGAGPVLRARAYVDRQLEERLPHDRLSGVVRALATGYRGAIAPRTWAQLTRTGTVHLVAISGLHVGLVATLALLVVGRTWALGARATNRIPARRVAVPAALAAATLYAMLAGLTIPTRRALVMLTVALGALWWRRHPDPLRTSLAAFAAVLATEPTAVLSPGLWLSFGAVAFILYGVTGRIRRPGRMQSAVRVQLLAALGLFPLTLLFFGRASWIAPLANLLMVPVFGLLVVPLVLGGVVLLPLWPEAAQRLALLAHAVLAGVWPLLSGLAQVAGSGLHLGPLPLWSALLAVVGVVVLLAPLQVPGRLAGLVLVVAACWPRTAPAPSGSAEVTVLDVGQGLAVVVRTHRHVLMYDTGPRFGSGASAGDMVVVPYLRAAGVHRIDRVVVSHADQDHAGGLASLRAAFAVGDVEMGGRERLAPGARRCHDGQHWRWDGVRFRMLHPGPHSRLKGNDASCVLRVATAGGAVLLTGDLERAGEQALLRRHRAGIGAAIMLVPHHGSQSSSGPALLAAADPALALVSAGWGNRYGLPSAAVVRRYQAQGARVLNTARDGAVTVRLGPEAGPLSPQCWRAQESRYWNAATAIDAACNTSFGR